MMKGGRDHGAPNILSIARDLFSKLPVEEKTYLEETVSHKFLNSPNVTT